MKSLNITIWLLRHASNTTNYGLNNIIDKEIKDKTKGVPINLWRRMDLISRPKIMNKLKYKKRSNQQ